MSMSNCPHVVGSVGVLRRGDLEQLLKNPSCDVCRVKPSGSHLWLCLYPDCYMLGCADRKVDHSTQHHQEQQDHVIQLNISTWRSWCYACANEIVLTKNEPAVRGVFGYIHQHHLNPRQNGRIRGLIGLCNLGNTCYMNAALQCLSNSASLTEHLLSCPELIPRDNKPNLSLAFRNLLTELWNESYVQHPGYVEPSGVLYAIKTVFPSFRGFQQHDAQEFLRCMMDQLHKELSEPVLVMEPEDDSKGEDSDNIESLSELESNGSSNASSELGDEFETASENSTKNEPSTSRSNRKRKLQDLDSGLGSMASSSQRTRSFHGESARSGNGPSSATSLSDQEYTDARSDPGLSSGTVSPKIPVINLTQHKPGVYRSIITRVFDGKLVSSVKCLSCSRVSKNTETFQDLSLSIPSQDGINNIRQRSHIPIPEEPDGWISWAWKWVISWFYGPDVTLQDCLGFFFSEDELKGDNMYSCEKCKKLRNGLKFSKVTELPEILCIHLKRFRHDFAFSSKIGTRVVFPLSHLDMGPWTHKDCVSSQTLYNLVGVICHHGTAGGGHYTSYCLNGDDKCWYHYDDSCVTRVDAATVAASEAYVLFYRKDDSDLKQLRDEIRRLQEELNNDSGESGGGEGPSNDSLVQHHVSKAWLTRFFTMAEPGPIDNSSVLCPHGGVLPHRTETASKLCTPLPLQAWQRLYQRFGGSPAVTGLKVCSLCLAVARKEEKQRRFEQQEFKLLMEEEMAEMNEGGDRYCVVASWFRAWEAWALGKAREPPGPINNMSLYMQRGNMLVLRPHIDHFKFSEDIWSLFLSLYSGGPEVVIKAGGGLRVSSPRPAHLAALAARLRARCEETSSRSNSESWS